MASNRGKVIERKGANLFNKGNALTSRHESEGYAFKSRCLQKNPHKIVVDHLVWNLNIKHVRDG